MARHQSDITVTRRTEGLAEVVTVAGEIDIATAGQFRAELIRAVDEGLGSVIVDMAGAHDLGGLKYHIERTEKEDADAAGHDDQ